MTSRLIILRGNSGSGKSTTASELRTRLGQRTMLVPQDVVRREILRVSDEVNNPSIELIHDIALYGKSIDYDVIVEGILTKKKYGEMLSKLIDNFEHTYIYYFDISFGETLKRHSTKVNAKEFGEKEMKDWWKEKDYLGLENEKIFTDRMSENDILEMILEDIG
jgi:predicted kinase